MNNGDVVLVRYGSGGDQGHGAVEAICDAPMAQVRMVGGAVIWWRQDLCSAASHAETVDYWRRRALAAEARALSPSQP